MPLNLRALAARWPVPGHARLSRFLVARQRPVLQAYLGHRNIHCTIYRSYRRRGL